MPRAEIQTALAAVCVNTKLFEGIPIKKVTTKGKLVDKILFLSPNKFTLHTLPVLQNGGTTTRSISVGSSSIINGFGSLGVGSMPRLMKPVLKKVASVGSVSTESTLSEYGEKGQELSIDIGSIDRVQKGQTTLKFEQARKMYDQARTKLQQQTTRTSFQDCFDPNLSLSIIYRGCRSLDVLVYSRDTRDDILEALRSLTEAYQRSKVQATNEVLLMRYIWLDVDKDQSGTLDVSELADVLKRINYNVSAKDLKESCRHFAVKILGLDKKLARKGFTFDQAVTFLHKLRRDGPDAWVKKPLNEIWEELFGMHTKLITHQQFLNLFLRNVQKEHGATLDYVKHVFRNLNNLQIASVATDPMISREPHKYLDKHRFEVYLNGVQNDIYEPTAEHHSPSTMSKPLSHYWINSSHNTYLTGDQISSYSSAEMYLNAFYRGCRCVEVDVWNTDDDPTPRVYHGYTITTKILFRDTIESIRNFIHLNPNTYPIIVSIENHCNARGQEEMVEILVSILGTRLYVPNESDLDGMKPLPSPESLKGRVVLKGRRPPEGNYDETYNDDSDEDCDDNPDKSLIMNNDNSRLLLSPGSFSTSTNTSSILSGSDDLQQQLNNKRKTVIRHKVLPDLARLTLFHGTRFKDWKTSLDSPPHHMHSFKESTIQRIFRKQEQHNCVIYNKTHMTRVYPSGTRFQSTNFSPVLAWSMGCQLVALNFQTPDAPLRINDGFFRQNGNCGYVLKTRDLLDKNFHGKREDLQETLTIRILSGSCLPKPKGFKKGEVIDPYINVAVYDVVVDDEQLAGAVKNRYQTKPIPNNGFSPIWNQEDFCFTVENESVAMLLFTVWDKDRGSNDDFIASASVPISCLREGYRSVKLYDAHNTRSGPFDFASLLVKVTREVIV